MIIILDGQTSIFELLYPTFKIDKPIRTIELFGGYGSQLLALKYLGANVEQWKLCEWAIKSIQAYKDLHFENDNFDYSKELSAEQIKDFLYKKGISSNYNEPMTQQQVNRLNEKQVRTIYNNIKSTHNLVNIQQVKGEDLEISDVDKYTYIMTYSFPCQDLSLAGKGKGMSDTTTRSGMLWEVERILTELKEKPQVLLMENVPQVHGADNVKDFNKWQLRLEELGYKNYWQDLIATDYGIPQTRNRTFMVSILGDYNYTFPKPIPLKLKLKDLLEDNVDEKYYLSDKMINYITSEDDKYKVSINDLKINRDIACSKTTREGNTRADTSDYICDELPKNYNLKINCEISNNKQKVVIQENDVLLTNYLERRKNENDFVQKNDISCTLLTDCGHSIAIKNNLKIRRLTQKECFRLMGVKDEDYKKIAKNQSDSSLYHLAGDSIVCQGVLTSIFKELIK